MPVYLDEKDSRVEFIAEQIKTIGYDSSDFAAYIYFADAGISCEMSRIEYKILIDNVSERFPECELPKLIDEIASVMRKREREYMEAWSKKLDYQGLQYTETAKVDYGGWNI